MNAVGSDVRYNALALAGGARSPKANAAAQQRPNPPSTHTA
jgi:hypothetical protein